jgi:putative ABC transport system permease protein
MKFARLVFQNLLRNRRRTALTLSSILLSIFVFSALISLPVVAEQLLKPTASSLRVVCQNKAGGAYALPEAHMRKIAGMPHVNAVVAVSSFAGRYHEVYDEFPNFVVDGDLQGVYPDWNIAPDAAESFGKLRRACLVGKLTMQRFGLHIGQQITLHGTWYPVDVTLLIVGALGGTAPGDLLVFHREYLAEGTKGAIPIGMFWVRADALANVPVVASEVDRLFANSDHETHTESEEAYAQGFLTNFRLLFVLAEILGSIVVLSVSLAAANAAAMSARERGREIAIMRVLGFTAKKILAICLIEAGLVALVGGVLGCGAAYLALRAVATRMSTVGIPPSIIGMTWRVAVQSIFVALLVGLGSAAIPYGLSSRRSIIDSIRSFG